LALHGRLCLPREAETTQLPGAAQRDAGAPIAAIRVTAAVGSATRLSRPITAEGRAIANTIRVQPDSRLALRRGPRRRYLIPDTVLRDLLDISPDGIAALHQWGALGGSPIGSVCWNQRTHRRSKTQCKNRFSYSVATDRFGDLGRGLADSRRQ
jgi:hypothetical protein